MAIDEEELGKQLREWRRLLATEVGTEPPCPFCKTPRLKRSDYLRCGRCGLNWDYDQDIFEHPHQRTTPVTGSTKPGQDTTVPTVKNPSDSRAWRDAQAEKIRARLGMPKLQK